jgi:FkbM family methyltransferase
MRVRCEPTSSGAWRLQGGQVEGTVCSAYSRLVISSAQTRSFSVVEIASTGPLDEASRSWRPGEPDTILVRPGTFDAGIWASIAREYPTVPARLQPTEVVVDIGCHTGAFCDLAARRGATVFGFEASFENYALACINLAGHARVHLRHAAVWRSDLERTTLQYTPNADLANTGGGSVLFAMSDEHWSAEPEPVSGRDAADDASLSPHPVPSVALDDVLAEVGLVRFLKIDAEGAEFPILLTSRRLDLVTEIAGEYHEVSRNQRARLAPAARIGLSDWSRELLQRTLEDAGFEVHLDPSREGRGLFRAKRVS